MGFANPDEVIITHASMSTSSIPLWVAQRQNLFAKYGVKSKIVWVRGNRAQIATLASGDTQVAYGGATAALAAAVGGKEFKIIASLSSPRTWIWSPAPASTAPKNSAANVSASRVSAAAFGKPPRSGSSISAWTRSATLFR